VRIILPKVETTYGTDPAWSFSPPTMKYVVDPGWVRRIVGVELPGDVCLGTMIPDATHIATPGGRLIAIEDVPLAKVVG